MKLVFRVCLAALLACAAAWSVPNLQAESWMTTYYEAGSGQNGFMPTSALPWDKYTHIIHMAASTMGDGNVNLYYLTQAKIDDFIKSRPAGKKALVAIIDNYQDFSLLPKSASPANIDHFVTSIVDLVVNNGYDGVDLDWEKNVNATQLDALIRKLRSEPRMQGKLITLAANPVHASVAVADAANLDQVNVMCYDFDYDMPNTAWYGGALRSAGNTAVHTCEWKMNYFTSAGFPRAKLGVGIPFYGRKWPGVTQAGQASSFSNTRSFRYHSLVTDPTLWKPEYMHYDEVYGSDYLSIPDPPQFVSFNGPHFIKDAVAWQKTQGFGGMMTYSVEYDYLPDQTGDARYPLTSATYNEITPAAPTNFTAMVGTGKVDLQWSGSFAAVSFNVYRDGTKICSTATTSCVDTTVEAGKTYSYSVVAVNGAGQESGNSASATASIPAPPVVTTRVEETSSAVTYTGTWNNNALSAHSGKTAKLAMTAGYSATFSFNGTSASWIAYRDKWSGIAQVYVDGAWQADVDTYIASAVAQYKMYTVSGLSAGAHTLTIKAAGRRSAASAGNWIWVDAFETNGSGAVPVPPPPPVGATYRVEQNNSRVQLGGSWNANSMTVHSGGSAVLAMNNGDKATFTFTGDKIAWVAYRDKWSGIARVLVDGELKATVDTYSLTALAKNTVFSAALPWGTHTVVIEATGSKSTASAGKWIWLDAFDYNGS